MLGSPNRTTPASRKARINDTATNAHPVARPRGAAPSSLAHRPSSPPTSADVANPPHVYRHAVDAQRLQFFRRPRTWGVIAAISDRPQPPAICVHPKMTAIGNRPIFGRLMPRATAMGSMNVISPRLAIRSRLTSTGDGLTTELLTSPAVSGRVPVTATSLSTINLPIPDRFLGSRIPVI